MSEPNKAYSIIREDITKLNDVDVIVNAANNNLYPGGNVCGAIFNAAGNELDKECQQYIKDHGPLPVSGVATTGSHNLSKQGIKKIVHAVGPVFDDNNPKQSEIELEQAIKNVLNEVFVELKLNSVAIPAISSGIYRFPKKLCAEVFKRTIPRDKNIILCIYEEDTYNIFRDVFDEENKKDQSQNQKVLDQEQSESKKQVQQPQQKSAQQQDRQIQIEVQGEQQQKQQKQQQQQQQQSEKEKEQKKKCCSLF